MFKKKVNLSKYNLYMSILLEIVFDKREKIYMALKKAPENRCSAMIWYQILEI